MKKKGKKKEEEEEEEENLVVNKTPKPNRKARNEGKKEKKKRKKREGRDETEKVGDPSRRDAATHAMTPLPTHTRERPILLPNTHAAISCRIPKLETHLAAVAGCSICTTQPSFVTPLLQPSQFTGI